MISIKFLVMWPVSEQCRHRYRAVAKNAFRKESVLKTSSLYTPKTSNTNTPRTTTIRWHFFLSNCPIWMSTYLRLLSSILHWMKVGSICIIYKFLAKMLFVIVFSKFWKNKFRGFKSFDFQNFLRVAPLYLYTATQTRPLPS